ncbi:MAG: DUF2868 domain-containing protein [Syntrophobacteraceae bacterium]
METKAGHSASPIAPEAKKPVRSAIPKTVVDVNDPGRASLVVTLREEEYRKALLVQTVVNVAPELVSQEAIKEAEFELKREDPPERSIIPISEVLLDHLPSAYRRLAMKPLPWPRLQWIVPLLAFLIGVLSNVLSPLGLGKVLDPQRTIHVFVNPIVMLILWNITVVGCFMVFHRRSDAARSPDRTSSSQSTITSRRKERQSAELDLPFLAQIVLRPLLRLWAMFVDPVAEEIVTTAAHARVAGLFLSCYFRVYRRPIIARVEAIVNLSAICLAAGAIAGMYIQAVVWDYSFFWKSTLVESPGARLIIAKILFWPAALILGQSFPNIETVAAMAQGAGVPGAIWIHVFAITAMVYIFLPRLVLIYRSASEARKSSADRAITIDFICIREQEAPRHSGSYQPGEFFERPGDETFQQTVTLDYFSLDVNAMAVMVSLQSALIEQDIRNTKAGDFFGDSLTPKRTWYLEWLRLLKEGFANLPEAVRPALYPIESDSFHSALERLSQCSNPFVRELIVLELAAFETYWPLTAGEKGWAQKMRDLTKSTPSLSGELLAQSLENTSHQLGLPKNKGSLLRSELHSVNRSLSGYWKNIAIIAGVGSVAGALTFGIAAPIIGGLIGHSMGLAGAAAVKAGLAAMGGGAIACGGMGVAGGTAVIFGGGALLGMGVGDSVAATMNPASVLIQAVKIEVFLRCVVAEHENAKQVVKDVLCQLRTSITSMDDELKSVRLNPNTEKECIAEREEIIKILETCSKRCAVWAKERGLLSPTDHETIYNRQC